MTEAQFFKELGSFKGQFQIKNNKMRKEGWCCPIVAVARKLGHEIHDGLDYMQAAKKIGLNENNARAIAHCADYLPDYPGLIALRIKLEKTLGLAGET